MKTMPTLAIERDITRLEIYWREVLKLSGVPNTEARNQSNDVVVDTYLKLKQVQESRVIIYD